MKAIKLKAFLTAMVVLATNVLTLGGISANAEEETEIFYGDLNLDGTVKANDLFLIKKYVLGISTITDTALKNADCYNDGEVDVRDVLFIKKYILGIIEYKQLHQEVDPSVTIVNEDITFSIEEKDISVDDLIMYDTTEDGDYIIPVGMEYRSDNSNFDVSSLQFKLDTELELQANSGTGEYVLFANLIEGQAFDSNSWDGGVESKIIIYTDAKGYKESNGTACYINLIVPKEEAVAGAKFPISFNNKYTNLVFDGDFKPNTSILKGGYIEFTAPEVTTTEATTTAETTTEFTPEITTTTEETTTSEYYIITSIPDEVTLTTTTTAYEEPHIDVDISLDANGGDCPSNRISGEYYPAIGINTISTVPIPVKDGYTFDGWYDSLEGGNQIFSETGGYMYDYYKLENIKKVYAHWTKIDPYAYCHFDVDNDGNVNIIDLILLKKRILGII